MDGKLRNMTSIFICKDEKILMLFRQGSRVANNLRVASAGGHFEKEELNDAKACVLRELQEELSITEDMLHNIQLRYITLRYTNAEIRQNYYFFAELNNNIKEEFTSKEGNLVWFDKNNIINLEMPYTAKHVIKHFLKIGTYTKALYGGIADGQKVIFTEMPEYC